MSEQSINRSLLLHKDNLNPFALWDDVFLDREVKNQDHLATFYATSAKIAWFGFMVFSALFTMVFGLLNAYALPPALYALIHFYQPYMEFTYHAWKAKAEEEKGRKLLYEGLTSTYQNLSKFPENALKEKVSQLQTVKSPEKGELFIPLLAQYEYFTAAKEEKVRELRRLKQEILEDEAEKKPEKEQHKKRQEYFELEEQLCIQKIELAYVMHLLNHPFDKAKLSTFGTYKTKELSQFCSWQALYRNRSAPFFTPKDKASLTREDIQKMEILELYKKIYLES